MRLSDGRFHLFADGPMAQMFYGGHIIVSETFAAVLRDTCAHCLDLRRTELLQIATGKTLAVYYEVLPQDEITPGEVGAVRSSKFHAWHFKREHLFVSPAVAEQIRERGVGGISFSPGFSRFAGTGA